MTESSDTHKPSKLDSVQVMRAIGMCLVLTAHVFAIIMHTGPVPAWMQVFMGTILTSGEWVMDLFFTLSGFIMVYISVRYFGVRGAQLSFLWHRLTRVVPAYWFYTTLAVLIGLYMGTGGSTGRFLFPMDAGHVAASYAFIPYMPADTAFFPRVQPWPVLPLGWTLNFEILFYALFAVFLAFSIGRSLVYFAATVAVLLAVHLFIPFEYTVPYFWTSPQLLKFITGCFVGYAYTRGVFFNVSGRMAVLALGGGIFVLGCWYYAFAEANMHRIWFHAVTAVFCGITTGAGVLTCLRDKTAPRFWVAVGDASYSMYLSHYIVLLLLVVMPLGALGITDLYVRLAFIFIAVIVCFIVGHLSYRYLELPITHLLRRKKS